jgi:hypothetical protein
MHIFESHGNFDDLIKKYKLNIVIAKLVIILLCFLLFVFFKSLYRCFISEPTFDNLCYLPRISKKTQKCKNSTDMSREFRKHVTEMSNGIIIRISIKYNIYITTKQLKLELPLSWREYPPHTTLSESTVAIKSSRTTSL